MKRSLRERYKQIFEELDITRGMTVYLMVTETYEEAKNDITKPKVDRLNQQNIYLVVRDKKSSKNDFTKKTTLSDLARSLTKSYPADARDGIL